MIARSQSPSKYGRAKLDLLQARVIAAASSAAIVSSASRSNQIGGDRRGVQRRTHLHVARRRKIINAR
jgi:hypothetical protein